MSKSKNKRSQESYQQAVERLEDAVKELGDAAKGNFADRAADMLEQTAARLKSDGAAERSRDAHMSYSKRIENLPSASSQRPFRDLDNANLAGICAGIAPYLGLEIWQVRCLAVTGLIFVAQITIPAYIIAYFVLEPRSELDELDGRFSSRRKRKRHARNRRAEVRAEKRARRKDQRAEQRKDLRKDYEKAPAEAAAAQPLPPRNVLRSVQSTLNDAEARLRRMEGHVTSGRYELQKELRRIERTS